MYQLLSLRFSHFRTNLAKSKNAILAFFKNNPSERWLKVGIITFILGFSIAIFPIKIAHAVTSPHSEPYQSGPIRQSRNPISNENFQGGVEPSALNQRKNTPQLKNDKKDLIKSIKDKLFGSSSETAPADLKTRKNPTLERYTNEQR